MKLTHEYNEYVVGLVVTDKNTNRSVNFQYEKIDSNHPEPHFYLKWGCEGDDTYLSFTEEELEIITEYVHNLDDSERLEDEYTAIMYSQSKSRLELIQSETMVITQQDILDVYNDLD